MEVSSRRWGVLEMKSMAQGVAGVVVVLVATFCVLVQVADLDQAVDRIGSRSSGELDGRAQVVDR